MQDFNSSAISARVQGAGINKTKFPSIWVRLGIEGTNLIKSHSLFIRLAAKITISDGQVRFEKASDERLYDRLQKSSWITAWDLTIDSFTTQKEPNVERRSLKGSLRRVLMHNQPSYPMNLATLAGRVIQVREEGEWVRFGMSYLNPKATGTNKWPRRYGKLYVPPGVTPRMVLGHDYFIQGSFIGKDFEGNDDLIVVVNQVCQGSA